MRLFQSLKARVRSVEGNATLWRRSLHAALAGDLDGVAELLKQIVAADSEDLDAFRALGRVCRDRGDLQRAVAIHQSLVLRRDLGPVERIQALTELGRSLQAAGEAERALAAFEEVLVHDRRNVPALRGLEDVLRALGDLPRALVVLRRRGRAEGHRDRPAEARVLAEIARDVRVRGDTAMARRVVGRALRRDRDCVDALELAGDLEAARGRDRQALTHWRRAVEIEPSRGHSILPRAAAAHERGGQTEAWIAWLRRRVSSEPGDAAAWIELGRALRTTPDPEGAIAELRRLLRGQSDRVPGLVALGEVIASIGAGRNVNDTVKAYAELVEEVAARLTEPVGTAAGSTSGLVSGRTSGSED